MFAQSSTRDGRLNFINAVMGVELFLPHLQKRMLKARAVFQGWDRLQPAKSPQPLPFGIVVVVTLLFQLAGSPKVGLSCLLAFHGYLRVGELCSLRWKDVFLPGDRRLPSAEGRVSGLLIRQAKTGKLQFVPLSWLFLVRLLEREKNEQSPRSFVCPLKPNRFRKALRTALEQIGCGGMGFVPHFLRHGGATYDFMTGSDPATIQLKGRWRGRKYCLRYVQAGRGLVLSLELSSKLKEQISCAVRRLGCLQEFSL